MHPPTLVEITKLEKHLNRAGFSDRFHRVTFELLADGCAPSSLQIWVPAAYRDEHVERVARTILWRRLLDLAKTAKAGALVGREIDTLWNKDEAGSRPVQASGIPSAERDVDPIGSEARIVRYVLEGRDPVRCDDLAIWKLRMETPERWVGDTAILDADRRPVRICTVFLGLDMNFGRGQPILFETTVLGGVCDRDLYRYCTWQEAATGHAAIVERVTADDGQATDCPDTLKARDLANRTLKLAGQMAIKTLLEQTTKEITA